MKYFSLNLIVERVRMSAKTQGDTKKRELLKNATKIEEIQEKKILTEIEPLQLPFKRQ